MLVRISIPTILIFLFGSVLSDTPANCTYEDVLGEWIYTEGHREFNSSLSCDNFTGPYTYNFRIKLRFPDVAIDENGNKGFWTMVYNQGFEVVINYRKYFAFFYYENSTEGTQYYCDVTNTGWSHDVLGKNWACYHSRKLNGVSEPKTESENKLASEREYLHHSGLKMPFHYADMINKLQQSWKATVYPKLLSMSYDDLLRRAGGLKSRMQSPPSTSSVSPNLKNVLSHLPDELDWRNVSGVNYVSPVRDQGDCGSCYAFSSLGMLESRLRIMTNNSLQVEFSPQDVISCSEYSQGCDGGLPYLVAGKYAQDFGVLPESCYPYEGQDGKCVLKKCKRYYVAKYNYVGGFFGGCNEELMKLDLVQNGPLSVAMEVYEDFQFYSGGIYHHVNFGPGFNPFYLANHGVLIVGYGISNDTGEKFWIVKNSWSSEWGEEGYFRIRRGNNECNIESMAVSAIPIP